MKLSKNNLKLIKNSPWEKIAGLIWNQPKKNDCMEVDMQVWSNVYEQVQGQVHLQVKYIYHEIIQE